VDTSFIRQHYVTCLYVPIHLVGDASAQIVVILLVYVSILACCSALCIFQKNTLKFLDLIHALPTRGRKVHNSCFHISRGSFASREEKLGEMHLFGGACFHAFGSSFSTEFYFCSFAVGVKPFSLTLRSRQFWIILSQLC
jgi:hypothetical protein